MGLCSARFPIALVLMDQGIVIKFIAHYILLAQLDKSLVCRYDENAEFAGIPSTNQYLGY